LIFPYHNGEMEKVVGAEENERSPNVIQINNYVDMGTRHMIMHMLGAIK